MQDTQWRRDEWKPVGCRMARLDERLEALLSQGLLAVVVLMGLALCWHALP